MKTFAIPCLALLTAACLTRPVGDLPAGEESTGGSEDGPVPTTTAPPPPPPTTEPGDDSPVSTTGNADDTFGEGPDTGEGFGEGEPCDLESPDPGCALGLKCMPYSNDGSGQWNAAACFPIHPEAVGLYEACEWTGGVFSGYDNCGDNAFCRDYTGEGGTCQGMCLFLSDDWDDVACEDAEAVPGWGCQSCFCTCDRLCHPLEIDACPEGEACYPFGGHPTFGCAPDASGEMGAYGDQCEFINVCDPGHMCANADIVPGCEGIGCCTPFCDLTQPNTCPGAAEGQECIPWFEEGSEEPGFEDLGVCGIPQ